MKRWQRSGLPKAICNCKSAQTHPVLVDLEWVDAILGLEERGGSRAARKRGEGVAWGGTKVEKAVDRRCRSTW